MKWCDEPYSMETIERVPEKKILVGVD